MLVLTSGNSFAKDTATPIPIRKKFFDTNALDFATMDGGELSSSPPPPLIPTTLSQVTRNPSFVPKFDGLGNAHLGVLFIRDGATTGTAL